jgi:hypothetical protein
MPDRVFGRATEVQAAMTARGTHRSAGVVDPLLTATAELSGLTLVTTAMISTKSIKVTGQPATWVAAPGSIR